MSDLSGDALAASIMAEAEGATPKKQERLLPTLAAVGILTLVAIGGGGGVGMLLASDVPSAPSASAPADGEAATGTAAAGPKTPTQILKLSPVVTNIASPATALVRVEASIVIRPGEVDNPELLAAQIQGDTLTFLRTIELAQVEGARGLLHLREDLRERARLRSPAVSDYLIQSLVAQ